MSDARSLEEKAKILGETAQISWRELQPWFARGAVIHVVDELDLVEVAHALQQDDTRRFEHWLKTGQVEAVTDETARRWVGSEQVVWAVVIRPWILVQERATGPGDL